MKKVKLLDCTLRDGSYINSSKFGIPALRGIIKKMQAAGVDVIECGWLKDTPHEIGSAYFHVPSDMEQYLIEYDKRIDYVAMIDWDRYDTDLLLPYDGKSINAVRVVFPRGKCHEGLQVGRKIREKGYQVYIQAANTLSYNDAELEELVEAVNEFKPKAVSVVDTFGAMYFDDLQHIIEYLDSRLLPEIQLGFHSHNNQQLSFALTIKFIELLENSSREVVVDASLCGMGRGAGNATTELVANYLNQKQHGNYDMNAILDAIDMYIDGIREKYTWGYSTPYFIAGMYQCHVNNIAYLRKNHRTSARDMRNIIDSLGIEERRHYDYDLLEKKFLENQDRIVDDANAKKQLNEVVRGRTVLLVAPGKTIIEQESKIKDFIKKNNPVIIGVNAIITNYISDYDYLLFVNRIRYDYAKEAYSTAFDELHRIVLSNIHNTPHENELVINFNNVIKRGWEHFDNAVICAMRMLARLDVQEVAVAGFDGFKTQYNESYADALLPNLNTSNTWESLNREIKSMFLDVKESVAGRMEIKFITDSIFDVNR